MKQVIKRFGILSLILAMVALTNIGCKKKKPTIAEITVRNSAGAAIAGAQVHLFPVPTNQNGAGALLWDYTGVTNAAGVASFNFDEVYQLGQAGVVVANIEASGNGTTGTGVIKVDQETTSTAVVFL